VTLLKTVGDVNSDRPARICDSVKISDIVVSLKELRNISGCTGFSTRAGRFYFWTRTLCSVTSYLRSADDTRTSESCRKRNFLLWQGDENVVSVFIKCNETGG